jgi:hypothetical protein
VTKQDFNDVLHSQLEVLRAELVRVKRELTTLTTRQITIDRDIALIEELLGNGDGEKAAPAGLIPLKMFTQDSTGDRAPRVLHLPNDEIRQLGQWNRLLIEVSRYLHDSGKLKNLKLPVRMPGATRYLLSTEKVHRNRREFFLPIEIGGGIWLETHASARSLIQQTRFLLDACGEDLTNYLVEP